MGDHYEEPDVCFNCTKKLNKSAYVKCSECTVNVCMLCFQCGAESPPHRRGHNYEVIKPSDVFSAAGWTQDDEFELLKAAHKFKMGNWGEIAESMGRGRKDGQGCKDYFEKNFVRGWIGQFSIKSANWDRIKCGMYINQALESVLPRNCLESTERMLLIRDAINYFDEELDENDPKVALRVQQLLEQYVQKCVDGEIEIKYEHPKRLSNQYEKDLSADENDPEDPVLDQKPRKLVKLEVPTDESDEESPGPSCSYKRSGRPPSPKKRKTTRVMRESSSESDEDQKNGVLDAESAFQGAERETEDDLNESAFETAIEFDSDDEEDEKKRRNGPSTSSASTGKRKKRKRTIMSKKDRRLHAFRVKMNREQRRGEKKLAGISSICSSEEVKELRSAYPRLLLENNACKPADRPKIRPSEDLSLLGYNVEREEFETEWFNDAEQLISRLTISAGPAEKDEKLDLENDIKFARLRQYIRILGIRKAKRNTILEHDKINEFFKFYKEMAIEKKTATEVLEDRPEKEKLLTMTQQFLTKDEYQALRACIDRIDVVVSRIEDLQKLQRNGETTLKNAPPATERARRKKLRKVDCEQRKKIASEWTKYKKWHASGVE